MELSFAQPWLLVLLAGLPFVWIARRRAERRSVIAVSAPGTGAATPGSRSRLLSIARSSLEILLLAGVVLAAARPHERHSYESVREEGIDLALVLDISASMQAADIAPNRLAALKELAQHLVEGSTGNRIGVFVFAGHVFTQTPLTTDTEILSSLIAALRFETIRHDESGGTALGDALLVASDALTRQKIEGRDQLIVVFTDGESNQGVDPLLAARHLYQLEIPLRIIGLGRTEPVPVRVYGRPFITTRDEILRTRLQEEQLQEVAQLAGGIYRHAESRDVLEATFADLEQLTRAPLDVRRQVIEHSLVPQLAVLLLILFLSWLTLEAGFSRSPLR